MASHVSTADTWAANTTSIVQASTSLSVPLPRNTAAHRPTPALLTTLFPRTNSLHKLPTEILSYIMTSACDGQPIRITPLNNYTHAGHRPMVFTLSMVCRRWRNIIHDLPHLWCDIEIRNEQPLSDDAWAPCTRLVRSILERTRQLPLHIRFNPDWVGPSENNKELDGLFRLLSGQSHRWTSLDLRVGYIPEGLFGSDLSALQTLTLLQVEIPDIPFQSIQAPNLTTAYIVDLLGDPCDVVMLDIWSNLTKLYLEFKVDTYMELQWMALPNVVVSILDQTPLLTELHCSFLLGYPWCDLFMIQEVYLDFSELTLAYLETLEFQDDSGFFCVAGILPILFTPSLRDFDLVLCRHSTLFVRDGEPGGMDDYPVSLDDVRVFLQNTPTIDRFRLYWVDHWFTVTSPWPLHYDGENGTGYLDFTFRNTRPGFAHFQAIASLIPDGIDDATPLDELLEYIAAMLAAACEHQVRLLSTWPWPLTVQDDITMQENIIDRIAASSTCLNDQQVAVASADLTVAERLRKCIEFTPRDTVMLKHIMLLAGSPGLSTCPEVSLSLLFGTRVLASKKELVVNAPVVN